MLKNLLCLIAWLCSCLLIGCEDQSDTSWASQDGPQTSVYSGRSAPTGPSRIASAALAPPKGAGPTRFTRVPPEESGISFANPIDVTHPLKRLYHSGFLCGGVAIGDVDGDDLPDLYLVSGPGPNKLYRQVGDFQFEDITDRAGVGGGQAWGASAAMVDIDNDSDLDIYVCNYDAPNLLYINHGDGSFTESAGEYGVDFVNASLMATFCDYDLDGDLDFYLLVNRFYREGGRPPRPPLAKQGNNLLLNEDGEPYISPDFAKYYALRRIGPRDKPGFTAFMTDFYGHPDRLIRNNGDGTFADITDQTGIHGKGIGLAATWWDYDHDGLPDLYICNDFDDPDRLYHNNGDGTFTDKLKDHLPHTCWFAMGADFGDINNDGLFDFFAADMSGTNHFAQKTTMGVMSAEKLARVSGPPAQYMRNVLLLNTGTQRFMEVAHLSGLPNSDWTWAVKFADLDNDGRLDVFISNGMARNFTNSDIPVDMQQLVGQTAWDVFEVTPTRPEQNLAFRNLADLRFQDVSRDWGLDHVGMSVAAAHADLDRDGDLDLVVVNLDEPVSVYRNDSVEGRRVLIRLAGTRGNRYGIGAVVRLESAQGRQIRQLIPMTGYLSSNEPLIHFGLGADATIDRLTVEWPGGQVQQFENLPADRYYTITEPEVPVEAAPQVEPRAPQFESVARQAGLEFVHREIPFDDFARQPLLPNKLSQLGPGLAWGDSDGDGDEDLFVGGAAGQAGALYVNQGGGRFARAMGWPWSEDKASEDMAPLWLDGDGDGDLDLLVTSGSGEYEPGAPLLQDRLYLNDGSGKFQKAPEGTLPVAAYSSSTATAADFDGDGDLDLFIGGRVIPGQYPLAPISQLLRNDAGRFTDVTDDLAPALRRVGLVTGALWSDADDDGQIDLLVTLEWGPVKFFRNVDGKLEDQTQTARLANRLGWWNAITGADLDGDGDIDYVVTNFGLNTKYHASGEKPALLFYGDFEGAGAMKLVEAEFEADNLFPIRGKSCSTNAMPFLAEKFDTYRGFALASLQEIYTPQRLINAHRFEVNTLESGVLLNDGSARFTFRPLPRLAQASPGFGVVLTEIDGDGKYDLYLVQNFFSAQAETGHMDGGLSLLFRGNGDGTFTPVWPAESGMVVPGDAMGLAACDLNQDGWPDFVVTQNNDRLLAFRNRGIAGRQCLAVRLQGLAGNPTGVGAKVTVRHADHTTQTAEVYAGSGYLSQSSATLFFAQGAHLGLQEIQVHWPDGRVSIHIPEADTHHMVLPHPG